MPNWHTKSRPFVRPLVRPFVRPFIRPFNMTLFPTLKKVLKDHHFFSLRYPVFYLATTSMNKLYNIMLFV